LAFKPVGGTYYEKHFRTDQEVLALIAAHGTKAETWVSMATYSKPGGSRSQENAERLCAVWLDVDAHEGDKYKSVDEVEEAIRQFIDRTQLPWPTILTYTGYGVHAIWTFTQSITRNEWQPVADKLEDLGKRLCLDADPITADAARILRVPGTLNFRYPQRPRPASFLETGAGHLDFDDFASDVDQALSAFPAVARKRGKHSIQKRFDCPESKANIEVIEAMLAAIDPDCGYCDWRNYVWSVAATGWNCSYDLARAWSVRGTTWEAEAFDRVWDSFDEDGGIGFGTLVHHARQAGYKGGLPSKASASPALPSGGLITVCAADIEPEHVEWLVDQSFPLGMLAVIGGEPGKGKSQIALSMAAGVTAGIGLPGTHSFNNFGSVIILANEDDAARTIRPRLDAVGADVSKIHIVQGVAREGADVDLFQLDSDIADLRQRALQLGDVRLIIIDPPSAYLGTKVDSYKDSDVRRVLMPLGNLAQETGAMILLIVHLNKRTDGGAQQRFSGSTAWTAAPRVGFMAVEDPLTKQRFLLPVKNNLGDDRLGYQYSIAERLVRYGGQSFKSSHVVWGETTTRSVGELLAPPKAFKSTAVDDARAFLEDELAGGPLPVEQLKSSAKAAGISWPSVNRAKKTLLINSSKVKDGWEWTLLGAKERGNV
jgi:RecA-family ATPase